MTFKTSAGQREREVSLRHQYILMMYSLAVTSDPLRHNMARLALLALAILFVTGQCRAEGNRSYF